MIGISANEYVGTPFSRGGIAISTVLSSGGTLTVANGGVASGTLVEGYVNGGLYNFLKVSPNGSTVGTTVKYLSYEILATGARTTGTILSSGGSQTINTGAVASLTHVSNGGVEDVLAGGLRDQRSYRFRRQRTGGVGWIGGKRCDRIRRR